MSSKFRILCLLVHHGMWNEQDHDVFKNIIAACKRMYKYVFSNKPLVRMLFKRFATIIITTWFEDRMRYWRLNGKHEHECTAWFSNGQLQSKMFYRSGKRHGECVTWYPNGSLRYRVHYFNDKREGKRISWFDNGQVQSTEFYRNDKLEGVITMWDPSNTTSVQFHYRNGYVVDNNPWCTCI